MAPRDRLTGAGPKLYVVRIIRTHLTKNGSTPTKVQLQERSILPVMRGQKAQQGVFVFEDNPEFKIESYWTLIST
jgi:hypothetical protein